jgi:hypothetical protein
MRRKIGSIFSPNPSANRVVLLEKLPQIAVRKQLSLPTNKAANTTTCVRSVFLKSVTPAVVSAASTNSASRAFKSGAPLALSAHAAAQKSLQYSNFFVVKGESVNSNASLFLLGNYKWSLNTIFIYVISADWAIMNMYF